MFKHKFILSRKMIIEQMQDLFSYGLTIFKHKFILSRKMIIGQTPQKNLNLFVVHIVEHCNLRCRFCDHFAPLAEKEFADIEVFEKDFARLSALLNTKVNFIHLLGGEPLLHPQLNDFLYVARKYFPKTEIQLVTNGTRMLKQTEAFWKACKDNSITIANTKYPLPLDFYKMKEVAKKHDVKFKHFNYSGIFLKKSRKVPLDLEGKQDINANFIKCMHANSFCLIFPRFSGHTEAFIL